MVFWINVIFALVYFNKLDRSLRKIKKLALYAFDISVKNSKIKNVLKSLIYIEMGYLNYLNRIYN